MAGNEVHERGVNGSRITRTGNKEHDERFTSARRRRRFKEGNKEGRLMSTTKEGVRPDDE